MRRLRARALLAGLLGVALVAAACGGDDGDSDDAAPTTSAAGAATTTTAGSAGGSTASTIASPSPTGLPANMDAWEKLWADQRQKIVDLAKTNKWGVSADGKTLTGPAGFKIDLSACPAGWSETEGLTRHRDQDRPDAGAIRHPGRRPLLRQGPRHDHVTYYADQWRLHRLEGQDPQGQLHPEGRRIRLGPHDPAGRRADRLGEGVLHDHAGLAEHPQDLRQAQPALHPPHLQPDRTSGLG